MAEQSTLFHPCTALLTLFGITLLVSESGI